MWTMGESQLRDLAVEQCFWHDQVQAEGQEAFSHHMKLQCLCKIDELLKSLRLSEFE